jgi:hypothetical protein
MGSEPLARGMQKVLQVPNRYPIRRLKQMEQVLP